MHQPLRLLTQYKLGKDVFWDLPNVKHEAGETLRDTAERAVIESVGQHCDVKAGLQINYLTNNHKLQQFHIFKHQFFKEGALIKDTLKIHGDCRSNVNIFDTFDIAFPTYL